MSKMALFQCGEFVLHSGEVSDFKIDCDALTADDWEALAYMIGDRVGRFSRVVGIPRGGWKLAEAMRPLTGSATDPVLIVDDVLTTGRSMEDTRQAMIATGETLPIKGAVVFARGLVPAWITPLFTLTPIRRT